MLILRRWRKFVVALFIVFAGIQLIIKKEIVANGISSGLSVCGEVLIPALFPFMMLSSFAVNSGVFDGGNRFLNSVFENIFKLPSDCFSVVLFGFTGGYPVGAGMISGLFENGKITPLHAKRLMSFCVNAGPAFVVTAAGTMLLGSRKAGFVLFISVCIASFIVGIITAFLYRSEPKSYINECKNVSLSDAVMNAVTVSCKKMIVMCGWVLIFSAVCGIIESYIKNETVILIFRMLSEVTTGINAAAELGGLPMVSFCISFGSFCVMCQLLPSIKKCGVKVYEYLAFRIVNAVLSFFTAKIILMFVHVPIDVFADMEMQLWSYTAPSSAILLIMCAVLIFDISSGQTRKVKLSDITG